MAPLDVGPFEVKYIQKREHDYNTGGTRLFLQNIFSLLGGLCFFFLWWDIIYLNIITIDDLRVGEITR